MSTTTKKRVTIATRRRSAAALQAPRRRSAAALQAPRRASAAALQSPKHSAKEAYRQAIIVAAEREFARAGFVAAKMSAVARAAGVAVGTLYNYFDSKEELFEQLLTQRSGEMHADLTQALSAGAPLEKLSALVNHSLANMARHSSLFAVFFERGAIAEYDIERIAGKMAHQEYQRFLDTLGQVLQAAVDAGDLRDDIPVPTMVAMLSGALNGVAYAWFRRRRRGQLTAAADDLLALFLAGARRTP